MNNTERIIYDKYAYDKTFNYIWRVYSEFERRVNSTQEEYEGLKRGECRFDYGSWENRLDITHKRMIKAIKDLSEKDSVIAQVYKGKKGESSRYFLTRFEEQKKEQKQEQNEEQKQEQKKASNINASKGTQEQKQEQKQEQNEEQEKVHTSKYTNPNITNPNILSKDIYSDFEKEVKEIYPGKKVKCVRDEKLPDILKEYGVEAIRLCIIRYRRECVDKEKQFILSESTFWNGRYKDYLDSNYSQIPETTKKNTWEILCEIEGESYRAPSRKLLNGISNQSTEEENRYPEYDFRNRWQKEGYEYTPGDDIETEY